MTDFFFISKIPFSNHFSNGIFCKISNATSLDTRYSIPFHSLYFTHIHDHNDASSNNDFDPTPCLLDADSVSTLKPLLSEWVCSRTVQYSTHMNTHLSDIKQNLWMGITKDQNKNRTKRNQRTARHSISVRRNKQITIIIWEFRSKSRKYIRP